MTIVVNDDREPPPMHFGDFPHGAYWSADRRELPDDKAAEYAVSGSLIRFMWDYGVTVPLWDAQGLLPEEPEELKAALGLSDSLIADLTRWGHDMNALDSAPRASKSQYEALDVRARTLADRLQRELGPQFTIEYRAW